MDGRLAVPEDSKLRNAEQSLDRAWLRFSLLLFKDGNETVVHLQLFSSCVPGRL